MTFKKGCHMRQLYYWPRPSYLPLKSPLEKQGLVPAGKWEEDVQFCSVNGFFSIVAVCVPHVSIYPSSSSSSSSSIVHLDKFENCQVLKFLESSSCPGLARNHPMSLSCFDRGWWHVARLDRRFDIAPPGDSPGAMRVF